MHDVEHVEVLGFDLIQSLHQHVRHVVISDAESHGLRHLREYLHLLRLVVDQLRFFLRSLAVVELAAHDRIAQDDGDSGEHVHRTAVDNHAACLQHRRVEDAWIRVEAESALPVDTCDALQ